MLEILEYLFSDFWRFLMTCVVLIILTQFKPVDVTILNGEFRDRSKKDESDA